MKFPEQIYSVVPFVSSDRLGFVMHQMYSLGGYQTIFGHFDKLLFHKRPNVSPNKKPTQPLINLWRHFINVLVDNINWLSRKWSKKCPDGNCACTQNSMTGDCLLYSKKNPMLITINLFHFDAEKFHIPKIKMLCTAHNEALGVLRRKTFKTFPLARRYVSLAVFFLFSKKFNKMFSWTHTSTCCKTIQNRDLISKIVWILFLVNIYIMGKLIPPMIRHDNRWNQFKEKITKTIKWNRNVSAKMPTQVYYDHLLLYILVWTFYSSQNASSAIICVDSTAYFR